MKTDYSSWTKYDRYFSGCHTSHNRREYDEKGYERFDEDLKEYWKNIEREENSDFAIDKPRQIRRI